MSEEGFKEPLLSEIDRLEQRFLVGRDGEVRLFHDRLCSNSGGIINLYGTGGVGKSYLLNEFRRISLCAGKKYLQIDCRALSRNPADFHYHLLRLVGDPALSTVQTNDIGHLTDSCVNAIRAYAGDEMPILVLDTFEAIGELEYWLREELLSRLMPDILVVVSGRFALQGVWIASPGWRQHITRMPLAELDFKAVGQYLERSGISIEGSLQHIWARTKGHPLTLSLLVATMLAGAESPTAFMDDKDVFPHVVANWLREAPDPEMRELVEAAAILREFNHELLNFVLEKRVTSEQFHRLITYSFVQRVERGWLLHDLLRDAVGIAFRRSSPDLHNRLWLRAVTYYTEKIKRSAKKGAAARENTEFRYYIANLFIPFMLYRQTITYHVEQLHPANWAEAEQYLEERLVTAKDRSAVFVDRKTNEQFTFVVTAKESLYTLKHIRLKELYEIDPSCIKLFRDEKGKIIGLMEFIPINERTMEYLMSRPISSSYFNQISEAERKALCVPGHTIAGYFVKTLDMYDLFDPGMMLATVSTFIHYLLTAGYVVATSISNPITDSFADSLGLEKTTIVHYDYDGQTPMPYRVLDTRGNKIMNYLNKMITSFGLSETKDEDKDEVKPKDRLSIREREVVNQLMKGRSNKEIANELFLSETTVKKHLTNIFDKLGVKNRAQLISLYKGD
ncbi:helix-turn-helix transcriptional regulator [Paenibacillus montanisoli]|nr:LuxR family transcriptional regulator [Paenibacillus montanisoli]